MCPFDIFFTRAQNWAAPHLLSWCGRACCPVHFVWSEKTELKKLPSLFSHRATSHLLESSDQRTGRSLTARSVAVNDQVFWANDEVVQKCALTGLIV